MYVWFFFFKKPHTITIKKTTNADHGQFKIFGADLIDVTVYNLRCLQVGVHSLLEGFQ